MQHRNGRTLPIAAALLGAVAAGSAASAQDWSGGWYLKGFAGATFPRDDTTTLRLRGEDAGEFRLKYDTGYLLGAAVGKDFGTNFAMELEYAYRKANIREDDANPGSSNAFMLNALYNFDPMGRTAPGGPMSASAPAGPISTSRPTIPATSSATTSSPTR